MTHAGLSALGANAASTATAASADSSTLLEHTLEFGREDTAGVAFSCVANGTPTVDHCAERVARAQTGGHDRSIATGPVLTLRV